MNTLKTGYAETLAEKHIKRFKKDYGIGLKQLTEVFQVLLAEEDLIPRKAILSAIEEAIGRAERSLKAISSQPLGFGQGLRDINYTSTEIGSLQEESIRAGTLIDLLSVWDSQSFGTYSNFPTMREALEYLQAGNRKLSYRGSTITSKEYRAEVAKG